MMAVERKAGTQQMRRDTQAVELGIPKGNGKGREEGERGTTKVGPVERCDAGRQKRETETLSVTVESGSQTGDTERE